MLLSSAPGPVQNLDVVFSSDSLSNSYNSTSRTYNIPVRISWQEPEYLNGELTNYSYRLVETGGDAVIEVTNTTDLTVVETVIVSPFTNYTATVVAYTNAGSGDSVMQVAVSPEAGIV